MADACSNAVARVNDLNFFVSKKAYLFLRQRRKVDQFFLEDDCFFYFFFIMELHSCTVPLSILSASGALVPLGTRPDVCGFFLPIIYDYKFSLHFYKFFFFFNVRREAIGFFCSFYFYMHSY